MSCAALLIAFALAPAGDPANLTDGQLLGRAEEAFAEGVRQRGAAERARKFFSRSALDYDRLRRRGADGVGLLCNLGSAALLADELPAAVLAYRRALERAPHDAEVRERLDYVRGQVQYPGPDNRGRPPADEWPPWLPRPARWLILLAAVLLYAGACAALTRWLMLRRGPRLGQAVLLFVLAAAAGAFWAVAEWRAGDEMAAPLAVIAAEEVSLRRGNGASYPVNPDLPRVVRGMEARLLHRRGGWLQVEFPGGHVGWVPESAALVDEPE